MKSYLRVLAVISSFCFFAAAEDDPKLPPLPWHMVNLWWSNHGEVKDFTSFSVDVDISTDMPSDQYNLYISPFSSSLNGHLIYGGLQTNCNGWDAMNPGNHKRLHGGPGFIFSRWSEKPDLTLKDVRATPGGFVEAAGYEGNFVSGRRPYAWKAGKYTFRLQRLDTEIIEGKSFTWVGAFVDEHATGRKIFVNSLRFPGDTLVHSGKNAGFMEFYATEKLHTPPDLATLPALEVKFSNLCYNGIPADLAKIDANFIRSAMKRGDGLTAPISPNVLHVAASADGKEITCRLVNKPFADSEEPNRRLWPVKK